MLLPHYTVSRTHSSSIPYKPRSMKHPLAQCSKFYWNRRIRNSDIVFVFHCMLCVVTNPNESLQMLSYSRFCSAWDFIDKLTLFSFVQREVLLANWPVQLCSARGWTDILALFGFDQREVLLTNLNCSALFSVRFYWQIATVQLWSAWGFTDKLTLCSFYQREVLLTNWHCSA
jgi:hypothetical protein